VKVIGVSKCCEGTAVKLALSSPDGLVSGSVMARESPLFSKETEEQDCIGGEVFSFFPPNVLLRQKNLTADELPIEPRRKFCEKKASQHEFDGQVVAATKKVVRNAPSGIAVKRLLRGFRCVVFGFLAPISCILWREFGDARRGCALDGVASLKRRKDLRVGDNGMVN
jgi:hypothetical protein